MNDFYNLAVEAGFYCDSYRIFVVVPFFREV